MSQLPGFLRPAPAPGERPPPDSGAGRYIRSFMFERVVIGLLGLTLPFILVFVDRYLFHGHPFPRDSESAYYYSGMREWFVLSVGSAGFFFIAYKITESNLDNTLSIFGGVCALVIAIFPTGPPPSGYALTPLQQLLGWKAVRDVHYAAAFGFVVAIGGICILFGLREKTRSPHGTFWRDFHFACAGVIGLALVWTIVSQAILNNHPHWSILAAETACALAFGASWFAKGFEIDYLLGRDRSESVRGEAKIEVPGT
jgi:hypothetical protein